MTAANNQSQANCIITLGRTIRNARREMGLSQREFADLIGDSASAHAGLRRIDFMQLSKIENDRIEVRDPSYDWLIQRLAEILEADAEYLEQLRQQTEPQPLNLEQAFFPVYAEL